MLTSYRVTRGFWNYLEGLNIISLSGTNVSLVAKERAMINYMSRNKDLFSKSVIKEWHLSYVVDNPEKHIS